MHSRPLYCGGDVVLRLIYTKCMKLYIYTSTVNDGSMKSHGMNHDDLLPVRERFLKRHKIAPDDATLVSVTYDDSDYCRYLTLDDEYRGDGVARPSSVNLDAVVVTRPGHALFLPLADCIGAVLYDPTQNVLMLSHLGRQALEQNGGAKSVEYLQSRHHVRPDQLQVWLSPAAGSGNYPLFSFDGRGLHDVAIEQLTGAGVRGSNIKCSPIDTTIDQAYFSHSQYLKGNRPTDGRFAVVAVIRP